MIRWTLLTLSASVLMSPALAEPSDLVDASDPQRIAELMQEEGYRAKVDIDTDGELSISSGAGGVEFNLYFKACDDDFTNCELLVFSAGFDLLNGSTDAAMTAWNQTQWTKAYLDDEQDPFLELPINVIHGISEANFQDSLNWFAQELIDFADHIGWEDEPPAPALTGGTDPI